MNYHRPKELSEAFDILANTNARILAGATDIYPTVSGRELAGAVLDITAIADLRGVSRTDFGWRIGATTKWSEVADAELPPAFNALQQAASEIGSLQIQNSGTIGGNICNASPAADGVPPLLVLDAEVEIASMHATRRIPLDSFILGVRKIDLRLGEIVTAIHIPEKSTNGGSAFKKFGARKYLVISICMVAARVEVSDRKISRAAVAVGSSSPVALRLFELENAMVGSLVSDSAKWQGLLEEQVNSVLSPIDDIRGDAASRASTAIELVDRAIRQAIESSPT